MPTGEDGDFPCFRCKLKRRAFQDKIIIKNRNKNLWQAKALCSCCGSKMNMGVPTNDFILIVFWGYTLVEELPKFSIISQTNDYYMNFNALSI